MIEKMGAEIHRIVESKKLKKKDVAEAVGISPSYFGQLRSKDKIEVELLESFCNVIDVSPLYFFDKWKGNHEGLNVGDISNSSLTGDATVNLGSKDCSNSDRSLSVVLAEKERLLSEKERVIKILLKQLGLEDIASL